VYDWEKSGKHRLIGSFEMTAQKMMDRVIVNGNADWDEGFELMLDDLGNLKGLINVLKADLVLQPNSSDAVESPAALQ